MSPLVPSSAMQAFSSHLRYNGMQASVSETLGALDALNSLSKPPNYPQARGIMRTIFAGDRAGWERFDELSDSYWLSYGIKSALADTKQQGQSVATRQLWDKNLQQQPSLTENAEPSDTQLGEDQDDVSEADDEASQAQLSLEGSTARPQMRSEDAMLDAHIDRDLIFEQAKLIAQALRTSKTRRLRPSPTGKRLDFRTTIRRSLATGGEPLSLARRRRKKGQMRISVLLDVSASMEQHHDFFFTFLKGIAAAGWQPEGFIFNTRLLRITSSLIARNAAEATHKFALQSQTMGGGTRIAGCLADFARRYGGHCLGRRSTVLVISDGFDSQPPEELVTALSQLRARTKRIIWLSPSLASADRTKPRTGSLAAAYPQLDLLAPLRTVGHLRSLATEFARL